ncbi:unnamed protein product [Closterium sp. NIES-54]
MVKEGKKDRALLALKKKKLQTDALAKLDAWVLRVEQQVRAELSLRAAGVRRLFEARVWGREVKVSRIFRAAAEGDESGGRGEAAGGVG